MQKMWKSGIIRTTSTKSSDVSVCNLTMIKKLTCFLFRREFITTGVEDYGHESIEYKILYFKCFRCGKKKQEREDC